MLPEGFPFHQFFMLDVRLSFRDLTCRSYNFLYSINLKMNVIFLYILQLICMTINSFFNCVLIFYSQLYWYNLIPNTFLQHQNQISALLPRHNMEKS